MLQVSQFRGQYSPFTLFYSIQHNFDIPSKTKVKMVVIIVKPLWYFSSMHKEDALLELCDVMALLVLLTLCRDSGGPHQETVQTLHCGLLRQLHLVQVRHVTATQLHSSRSLRVSFHLNKSEKKFWKLLPSKGKKLTVHLLKTVKRLK